MSANSTIQNKGEIMAETVEEVLKELDEQVEVLYYISSTVEDKGLAKMLTMVSNKLSILKYAKCLKIEDD